MDRDQIVQEMGEAFSQLKRAMQVYNLEHFGKFGVSPAQVSMLKTIHQQQPIKQKDLAKQLVLTPGAVSQLIEALDAAKCIIRTTSEDDRRVSYVSVSKSGEKLLSSYDQLREQLMTEAVKEVADEDLVSYIKVQKSLTRWLEDQSTQNKEK